MAQIKQKSSIPSCCTICSSEVEPHDDLDLNLDLGQNDDSSLSLSKDLEVFFILRNVLRFPSSLMQDLLQESALPPSQWGLQWCGLCRRMVQEAGFLFSRIRQLIKDYEQLGEGLKRRATTPKNNNGVKKVGRPSSSKGLTGGEQNSVLSRIQQHFKEGCKNADNNHKQSSRTLKTNGITARLQIPQKKVNTIIGKRGAINDKKRIVGSPRVEEEGDDDQQHQIVIKTVTSINEGGGGSEIQAKIEPASDTEEPCLDGGFYYGEAELGLDDDVDDGENFGEDLNIADDDEDCGQQEQEDGRPRRSLRARKIRKIHKDNKDDDEELEDNVDEEDEFVIQGYNSEEEEEEDLDSDFSETEPPTTNSRKRKRGETFVIRRKSVQHSSQQRTTTPKSRPHLTAYEAPLQQCPHCTCSVKGRFSLDAHILRVHQGVKRPFQCDICFQFFSKLSTVMLHIDLRHQDSIKNCIDPLPEITPEKRPKDYEMDPTETKLFNAIFTVEEIELDEKDVENPEPNNTTQPKKEVSTKNQNRKSRAMNCHLPYKCDTCSFHFSAQWLVNAHILRCHHGDSRSFECDCCTKRFARKVVLHEHRATYHPKITTPYDGPKTLLETRIAELAKKNKRPQIIPDIPPPKVKKIYNCTICNVKFHSRITSEVHLKRVHQGPDKKLPCPACDLLFLSKTGQKMHYNQVHVQPLIDPDDPELPFAPAPVHKKNQPYPCTENDCTRIFKRRTELNQHLRVFHSIAKQHMCELCSLLFSEPSSLKNHQLQHHHQELGLSDRNPFKCEFCDKVLNTRRNLEAHKMHAHTKQWKFPCPECPRGFAQEVHRKYHIRVVHLKVRPHTCPHPGCGRTFAQGFNLKSHIRVHTGEKPWSCRYCDKAFSDKSTYNRHLESHGEQKHICPTCGKDFKIWHSYRLHCMSHDKSGISRRRTTTTTPRSTTTKRTNQRKRKDDYNDDDDTSNSSYEEEDGQESNSSFNPPMPILTHEAVTSSAGGGPSQQQPPVLEGYSQNQQQPQGYNSDCFSSSFTKHQF